METRCEIAVVGGGLVGLATALSLVERGRGGVVVLEAESRLAAHQSGHNSGVVHSGLYYQPGSLKAQTCRDGRDALYRFCEAEGIPYRRCGKLVVATRPEELSRLDELDRRGRANGLHSPRRLGGAELSAVEPAVAGLAGLWIAETGVVDFVQVAEAYARRVRAGGGEVTTGARVTRVDADHAGMRVETSAGPLRTNFLVNCAGLQADRVARLCGVEPDVQIIPFRGEYYELVPERRALVRNLIYPVPDPTFPFLGVHFTRTIHDRVEAGPNAVWALKREGYGRASVSLRDVGDALRFPGFWRLVGRHWRSGLAELHRSWSKRAFVTSLQRLVPALRPEDVVPGGSGVRAQAVDRAGRLVDDFVIRIAPRSVHVLNAPSPAATASLSIGRRVADCVLEMPTSASNRSY